MTWLADLGWIGLTSGIQQVVVAVFRVVITREPGVGKREVKIVRLIDNRASFSAFHKGTKSLLAMVNLEYVRKRNDSPLRIPTKSRNSMTMAL